MSERTDEGTTAGAVDFVTIKQREISTEEGQRYAEQYKLNKFVETSAKTGFNAKNILIKRLHFK